METKVLLVNPNRMKPPIAPLGLELLASALQARGIQPVILDLAWEQAPLKAIRAAIKKSRPRAVCLSVRNIDDCYFASQAFLLPPLKRYVRVIKEATSAPVVLGGVGFSVAPAAVLAYLGADYGIRGDGEAAAPELVERLSSGREVDGVPGLVAPGGKEPMPVAWSEYRNTSPRRGAFELARYFRRGGQGSIETQRGCNGKCVYCADPVAKGRRPRYRDPESVAEELGALVALGVDVFHLCDSEFNLSRRHAEGVARAVIKAGLADRIKWYAYALPEPMDRKLAKLLASAGCAGIDFGVDAGNDEMLAALGCRHRTTDLERCADAMKHVGMPFMYDLLLGGPGETRKTMAATVKWMKKIRPDRVGVSFGVRVFPGTELARMVTAAGPLDENPCLHGQVIDNDDFFKPVYYLSDRLGAEPESYLKKIIGDDPIFFFASREDLKQNYNYNDNRPLCQAISEGARGAYWDVLRTM